MLPHLAIFCTLRASTGWLFPFHTVLVEQMEACGVHQQIQSLLNVSISS
jgi:hypothetical protein